MSLTPEQKALADRLPVVILATLDGRTKVVTDDDGSQREVHEGPQPKDIENAIKYLAAHGITKMPTGKPNDALTALAGRMDSGAPFPFPAHSRPLPPVSGEPDRATG